MLSKDRAALRNLVIAILGSTGALLVIGTTCLGRDRTRPDSSAIPTAERASVRSSAGGVSPAPVGTTVITAAQLERGASATGSPAVETYEAPVPHTHAVMTIASPAPAPPPQAAPPVTATSLATPAPPATPAPSPLPAATPTAPAPPQRPGAGVAPAVPAPRSFYRTPTEGLEAGAGQFMTEPPPFSASSLSPNPEAGAGPFVTDQAIPPPMR